MVKKVSENKQDYYACEECGFVYGKKKRAEECEAWCREHRSCNLAITRYAVSPGNYEPK